MSAMAVSGMLNLAAVVIVGDETSILGCGVLPPYPLPLLICVSEVDRDVIHILRRSSLTYLISNMLG